MVVFSIKPRKNDGCSGNCFGSVRSSFVTLLSALYAFSQGSNLGFYVARLYWPISTVSVCLSVCLSILHFLENIVVREGKL